MSDVRNTEIEGIPVEITRKKMKNMLIRIDRDTALVKVSIPKRVSFSTAEDFVRKNLEWVIKKRNEVLERTEDKPQDYVSGEMIELWGEKYPLDFIPSYSDKGVYMKENRVVLLAPLDFTAAEREELIKQWYRVKLWQAIVELKDECCSIAGVSPKEWHIRDMKTKWGTCNYSVGRIWLSLMLAKRPKICLKYVMLHELTHLYVPNHGPEFKAYMDKFCPEWRDIKKLLK